MHPGALLADVDKLKIDWGYSLLKTANWKAIVELIGISAIVASLITDRFHAKILVSRCSEKLKINPAWLVPVGISSMLRR